MEQVKIAEPAARASKRGLVLLGLILAFACFVHLPRLGHAYLPGWDEAIHALVAANLAEHPLTPTLIDHPLGPLDYRNWQQNHIWLHMPPWPFWQAALGLDLGGRTPFWLRLPGFVLFLASLVLIYRLGQRLYSEEAGLLGAALYAAAPFGWLEVQGYLFGDMTDVSLAFWSLAACFCLERALATGRVRFMVLGGLAQGAALLSKSALALAPAGAALLVWLLPRLGLRLRPRPGWRLPAIHLSLGLGLWWAWRLMARIRWPREYAHEVQAQWLHVVSSYEGHGRPADALFNGLVANLFTPAFVLLALVAAGLVAWRAWTTRRAPVAVHALWILGTWLPLLAVQTKVPAVLFGIAPALALAIGVLITRLARPGLGPWAGGLALAPVVALLLAGHLPADWFAFAAGLLADLAAAPHLPLQLACALVLGLVLWLAGRALRRWPLPRRPAAVLGAAWRLVLVVSLVAPFAAALGQQRLTRLGFDILADYDPVARTAAALGGRLPDPAAMLIEGVTNGRQRPALVADFLLDRPARLVGGQALSAALRSAKRIGPTFLFTPVERRAAALLSPGPGSGWWVYRLAGRLPDPTPAPVSTPLASWTRAPDLLRLEPARTRLVAGSPLELLALWRAKGPAAAFGTQLVLQPESGGAPLAPYPRAEDFPEGFAAVHLHNLAPPGLLWGQRPFGSGLGQPGRWRAGWTVADAFFIWVPRHVPPGRYRLVVRMLAGGRPLAPRAAVDWPAIEVLAR